MYYMYIYIQIVNFFKHMEILLKISMWAQYRIEYLKRGYIIKIKVN